MPNASVCVMSVLALAWMLFILLRVATSWLPDPAFVRELVESLGEETSGDAGILYALVHHFGMLFKVAVLSVAQAGAGAAMVRWLVPAARPDWLVFWGAGFGMTSLLTLGWGLAGLLFPVSAVLSTLVLGGLAFAYHFRRGTGRAARRERKAGKRDPWVLPMNILLAVVVTVLAALALAPDTSWDAVVYHLRLPAYFVQEHRIFHVPTVHFSAFPLATEMQGAWLMLLGGLDLMGGGEASKLYHVLCAVVAALAARRMAVSVVGGGRGPVPGFAGLLAAALVLLCPVTGTMAVRAYNDYVQAAMAALALMVLVEGAPGAALLAGVLCGGALSAKYTGVMFLIPLAVIWFRGNRRPYAAAAALAAPWFTKNFLLTGNPVAPFLYRLFPSQPETAFQFASYAGSVVSMSFNIPAMGNVFAGLVREPSGEMLTELLLILPAALFVFRRRSAATGRLSLFFLLFGAAWYVLAPSARFFGPGLAPLAVLAAAGFTAFEAGRGAWPRWALAVLLGLNLVRLPLSHLGLFGPAPFIAGCETARHYLGRTLYPAHYFMPAADWINRNLPGKSRFLVAIDIKAHYIWRRTLHDFQYVQPGLFLRWLREEGSVDGFLRRARREGITHVLVVFQRTRDVGRHYAWREGELPMAAEFLASHTRKVFSTGKVEVLEISAAALPRRSLDGYGWMLFIHHENLMLEGREAEAIVLLRDTLRRAPWLKPARAYLGMALARLRNYEEASPILTAAFADGGPVSPYAGFVLGQIRRIKGDDAGAEKIWRRVIRVLPDYPAVHFELGSLYMETGRLREGLLELAAAARLEPANRNYALAVAKAEQALEGR